MGVSIEKGVLHVGTVLCVKQVNEEKKVEILTLGTVESIEKNHVKCDVVREGDVAIKIAPKGTA